MMFLSSNIYVSKASSDWLSLNSLLWSTAEYAFDESDNLAVSDTIDMGLDERYCGTVLLLSEIFKSSSIVNAMFPSIHTSASSR